MSPPSAVNAPAPTRNLDRQSGILPLELTSPAERARAIDLFREGASGAAAPLTAALLQTIQTTGGYVFGAYDASGVMLGASVALMTKGGLHGYYTGVRPSVRRRGVALALKDHQRQWALDRGITTITSTCDPLVPGHVRFSLHAVGATVASYGLDHDVAEPSGASDTARADRFILRWDLDEFSGPARVVPCGRPLVRGTQRVALHEDVRGRPVVTPADTRRFAVEFPRDIEGLRRFDPATARAWQDAFRQVVNGSLSAGGAVLGLNGLGQLVMKGPA